jgi:predicted site-specific integrase-resolvase
MTMGISWCTLEEAESKFGVKRAVILGWVEDGLVRCEQQDGKVISVNVDDLVLKVEEIVRS